MEKLEPRLRAVIFDWAGTTVDYGSLAPLAPFLEVFRRRGVELTVAEARTPMGMYKRDHISALLQMESVRRRWFEVHQRYPVEADVDSLFEEFIPLQLAAIKDHADLIPGCLECQAELRKEGLKIGTTTGYDREMMDILAPLARQQGFVPDSIVCVSDVPKGRPAPWMAVLSAMQMDAYPLWAVLKVGDTETDIHEGINAGMWTAGVVLTGNAFGLTEAEVKALPEAELRTRYDQAEHMFRQAGAHFVVEGVWQIPSLVPQINRLLEQGEKP